MEHHSIGLRTAVAAATWMAAAVAADAGPGMWVPLFIDANIDEIHAAGGRLTAEQIYSANASSMKDAVMIFGGGCTGEVVSDNGLLLTNYHCGESTIGSLSSPAADYLAHGFTARSAADELPCPGLTARRLVRMADVSDRVKSLGDTAAVGAVCREAEQGGRYSAAVEEMFCGNQHLLMVYEVFRDIRLVVAPPQQLGGFGGETDNWTWPRHTADFSLFRIYADKENKPAPYSADNKPYRPSRSLTICTKGVEAGDFAMVMGYPGSTDQYLTAAAIRTLRDKVWPGVVALRKAETDVLDRRMAADRKTAIDYTGHYSSIANGRKRTAGEIDCTDRADIVGKMTAQQSALRKDKQMDATLASIDSIFGTPYADNLLTMRLARDTRGGSRTLTLALALSRALEGGTFDTARIERQIADYAERTDRQTERETLEAALKALRKSGAGGLPAIAVSTSPRRLARKVVGGIFATPAALSATLRAPGAKATIDADIATRLATALQNTAKEMAERNAQADATLHDKKAAYARRLSQLRPDSLLAPDANFTLRVAFGKVEAPRTGAPDVDRHFTTVRGIVAKNATGNPDYALDSGILAKLGGDYGEYAAPDGELHTCFVGSLHTTGGNSGSPTLNADGQLVGLNFDRIWQGIASDYRFDPERSRNISVDIRYVLFVIDKICGGRHIVEQMNIAQ